MIPSEIDIDLNEMIIVELPQSSRSKEMVLRVSESGFVGMNRSLVTGIRGSRKDEIFIRILRKDDYRIIAIQESKEKGSYRLNKDGNKKNAEFAAQIRAQGYSLPAKYFVEWNEKANAWVGILDEVPSLQEPEKILKDLKRKTVRRRTKKNV